MERAQSIEEVKVLLINTSFDRTQQYGYLDRLIRPCIPLSIGALAGYLLAKGVEVRIADAQVDDLSEPELRALLNDFNPDIVGMTCFTPNVFRVFEVSRIVKNFSADIWVVLGGAHPTISPDECLGNENVDFVVRQEGEFTLLELVQLRRGQTTREKILGLSFKDTTKAHHNPQRPFQQNLDLFPRFPFALLMGNSRRYDPGHLVTSRGCPYQCIFCSSRNISGYGYRSLSAGRVIEEIEGLIKNYQISSLMFEDDNFLVDRKRAGQICELLIRKGFSKIITWRCQARADLVKKDILLLMRQAGCVNISFGIETASQRLMELINKGETVEDNVQAVKLAKAVGLGTRGAFILGLPTETRRESLETIKFAKSLPLDEAKFSLATPYPGSPLYDVAKLEGCLIEGKWDQLSTTVGLGNYEPVYCPKGRSPRELKKLQRRAHLEFYLRPRIILRLFDPHRPDNISSLPRIKNFRILMNYLKTFILFFIETMRLNSVRKRVKSVDQLYSRDYFLSSKCEGYQEFEKNKELSFVKQKELKIIDPKPGEYILDVGCGRAELLLHCAHRGAHVIGVEYSSDAVFLANETLGGKGKVVKAKAEDLPFGNNVFDKIALADVLEHLTEKETKNCLSEMHRIVRPGGMILIHTSPNLNFVRLSGFIQLILNFMGKSKTAIDLARKLKEAEDRHINIQSPQSLKKLLKKTNFDYSVWVDADFLRQGKSQFAAELKDSKMFNRIIEKIKNLSFVQSTLGNDLYALIKK